MMNSITIENKSAVSLHGLKPGKRAEIEVDGKGVPLDQHWRRRLRDSAADGCIEVIQNEKPRRAKQQEAE